MHSSGKDNISYEDGAIKLEMIFGKSHLQLFVNDWTSGCTLASVDLLSWRDVIKNGIPVEEVKKILDALIRGFIDSEEKKISGKISLTEFVKLLPLDSSLEQENEWQISMYERGKNIVSYEKSERIIKVAFDDANLIVLLRIGERTLSSVSFGGWEKVLEKGIPVERANEVWETLTGHFREAEEYNKTWNEKVSLEEFITSFNDFIL